MGFSLVCHILNEGYKYNANDSVFQPVNFYPLYPLTAKALTIVSGINGLLALLVVANHCIFVFSSNVTFLSAGYTESLTLLLFLCCFLLLEREQYIVAAVFAGLASATRSTGLVLLPVIILELWCKFAGDYRRFFSYAMFCAILATSGLWLYMVYLIVRLPSQPTPPARGNTAKAGLVIISFQLFFWRAFFHCAYLPHITYFLYSSQNVWMFGFSCSF
jgi:hypothetical protein